MKKILLTILALVLVISMVSCTFTFNSHNTPDTPDDGEQTDVTPDTDPDTPDPVKPDETEDDADAPVVEEGEVTVKSLGKLKEYVDAGLFPEGWYEHFNRFLTEGWDYPEINDDVTIDKYSFKFTSPADYESTVEFWFNVAESELESMPVGEYVRTISDGPFFMWKTASEEQSELLDNHYAKILGTYMSVTGEWDTPTFFVHTDLFKIADYLTVSYCDKDYKLAFDEFARMAADMFGVKNVTRADVADILDAEGNLFVLGHGATVYVYDVLDVSSEDGVTVVTVQFKADEGSFINSHKVEYKFGENDEWLGYAVAEEGEYEPFRICF